MKLIINKCYGGFSLSYDAVMLYGKLTNQNITAYVSARGNKYRKINNNEKEEYIDYTNRDLGDIIDEKDLNNYYFNDREITRNDENLVKVVEQLGEMADGKCARLSVVEIPDYIDYEIEEYDGKEWVAEKHRTWS